MKNEIKHRHGINQEPSLRSFCCQIIVLIALLLTVIYWLPMGLSA